MTNYETNREYIRRLYLAWLMSGLFIINGPLFFSYNVLAANNHNVNSIRESVVIETSAEVVDMEAVTTTVSMEKIGAAVAETIVTKTIENNTIPETIEEIEPVPVYEITEDERELLARLVELEAGNQTLEERAKVVQVVFNRVDDGRFGEGVEGVIFASGQFEPAPHIPYTTPSEASYNAVDSILFGDIDLSEFNCLYFYGDGQLNHFY